MFPNQTCNNNCFDYIFKRTKDGYRGIIKHAGIDCIKIEIDCCKLRIHGSNNFCCKLFCFDKTICIPKKTCDKIEKIRKTTCAGLTCIEIIFCEEKRCKEIEICE